MRLQVRTDLRFDADATVPSVFMLRPRSGAGQWVVVERYVVEPSVPAEEFVDTYGNLCQRLTLPEGSSSVQVTAEVETSATIDTAPGAAPSPIETLPAGVLAYLLPSRYCPSDRLGDRALEIVGTAAPGYDQVEAVRAWIHDEVTYEYGTSDASSDALTTLDRMEGVCRDFTHLGVALCRALSIPARMVVGYLHGLDPMDQHAWFEAFVAGRWYTFDATQPAPRGGRVVIGYGRDAADVAFSTQFGPARLVEMAVSVERLDG